MFDKMRPVRMAPGDPRLSLEERYRDHAGYVQAVTQSVNRLVEQRLLLPADAERYISSAQASSVLK
ncbi:alpha/beta hydrolase domain-containing protein [Noviherbaspirillum sp.]|uniref:alpha/beta hydrolase domain-containing protein n=1 Tax=Noviherbaspirillum sp. TaxID=1926288 RepID=UPI002FE22A59